MATAKKQPRRTNQSKINPNFGKEEFRVSFKANPKGGEAFEVKFVQLAVGGLLPSKHPDTSQLQLCAPNRFVVKPNQFQAVRLMFAAVLPAKVQAELMITRDLAVKGLTISSPPMRMDSRGEVIALFENHSNKEVAVTYKELVAKIDLYYVERKPKKVSAAAEFPCRTKDYSAYEDVDDDSLSGSQAEESPGEGEYSRGVIGKKPSGKLPLQTSLPPQPPQPPQTSQPPHTSPRPTTSYGDVSMEDLESPLSALEPSVAGLTGVLIDEAVANFRFEDLEDIVGMF